MTAAMLVAVQLTTGQLHKPHVPQYPPQGREPARIGTLATEPERCLVSTYFRTTAGALANASNQSGRRGLLETGAMRMSVVVQPLRLRRRQTPFSFPDMESSL
jgi:hypothetical protein